MRRGCFITFEGLDGSGKSTQLALLAAYLERLKLPVLTTRQPGDTALGERIRALLLDAKSTGIAPMAEMAMMFADRAQSIAERIAPALEAGTVVLCDRFTDSTEAYQGGGRGLGSEAVLALHRVLCGNLQPDLTILLLPPLAVSRARTQSRNSQAVAVASAAGADRFEQERLEFHERVHAAYRTLAAREPERVLCIPGEPTVAETEQTIRSAVLARLRARGFPLPAAAD
jgi:dTMP kinase